MAKSPEAYVDTSAFIAFMDRSDSHHPLFRRLFSAPPKLSTTALVVAEGHGWFLRRYDRGRAAEFLALVEMLSPLTILPVGSAEIAAAARLMRRYRDQDLTLTDAVGLHAISICGSRACPWRSTTEPAREGVPPRRTSRPSPADDPDRRLGPRPGVDPRERPIGRVEIAALEVVDRRSEMEPEQRLGAVGDRGGRRTAGPRPLRTREHRVGGVGHRGRPRRGPRRGEPFHAEGGELLSQER
jgi:predicted nucleic acid-binding protein